VFERQRVEKTVAFVGAQARNTVSPLLFVSLRPRETRLATNVSIYGGKGHSGPCEFENMDITSLLHQVDPLIQAIAGPYRDTISSYDYDDLVQEGRLVVLEALRRYLKKHEEITPASISSWVFIAVNSRLKELATNGNKMVSCEVFDEDNAGDNGNKPARARLDAGLCRHVDHVCRLTQNNVVTPSLRDFLTTRDVAVSINRTTQRVVQLQKDFIKDWEQYLDKKGEE
jgi:hypothetical protein